MNKYNKHTQINKLFFKILQYFDDIDKNYNHEIKEIKLKLVGVNNITNMEQMFCGCYHLSSVSESKYENIQIYNDELHDSFFNISFCSSLFEESESENKNVSINNNLDINYKCNEEDPPLIDLYNRYNLLSVEKLSLIQKKVIVIL